ncbi:MAG: MBL fold metallo-hydrolase [Dehalococcoidia bacterium]|nr:MBL fold metallo-hydrolase [Dehalococcoidia bacterium]
MGKTTTIGSVEFERYIQSAFRLQSGDTVVYVDPHRLDGGPPADLILITHEHFDHMDPNAINAVATDDTVIVANAPCARQLQGKVKGRVVSIQEGDTVTEKGVEVRAVAGYNGHHPRGFNVGFVFRLADQTVFHAGDTDRVPEMSQLGEIDVALLPIGGTYTMAEAEAAEAVRIIRPRVVIPMHYGYATGGDPEKFASLVGSDAAVAVL